MEAKNLSSEVDRLVMEECSHYYVTITPKIERVRISFNVTEWYNPDGNQHSQPRAVTNIVDVPSEEGAQAMVNQLRKMREQFIRLRIKYEGMVL